MSDPILRLSDLNKSFGAVTVAKIPGFEVREGEALGVIGPNGAGKSTLFNLITGTLKVSSGTIHFCGRDVTRFDARARCLMGIGRSFQIPQPFEKLSVFENVLVASAFGGGKVDFDADFCAAVLERTGLMKRANCLAGTLNLLDRKRLELARALATQPRLLLLDEIAGGLTEAECVSLVATIQSIRANGTTIIWIEHVLHALNAVVERLLVLNFGQIIGVGPPREVMASKQVQDIYMGVEI